MGRLRDGDARGGGGRLHDARRHAAELPSGDDDVAALEAKREAAHGKCRVDWAPWGGVVDDNQEHIEPLAAAGVLGFKCFLIHPGIDGFTMVTEQELRAALPHVARTGLPLLVHAELAGPVERRRRRCAKRTGDRTRRI